MLSELADLRDRLKLSLSDHLPEGELSSAELAARIMGLRASVTVEEAPKREARTSIAEVLVTRRIKKKPQHPAEEIPPQEPVPAPEPPAPAFRQQLTQQCHNYTYIIIFL